MSEKVAELAGDLAEALRRAWMGIAVILNESWVASDARGQKRDDENEFHGDTSHIHFTGGPVTERGWPAFTRGRRLHDGQQRVMAPLGGIAVVAGALLGQSIGLADGGVQVDGQGPSAGSVPSSRSLGQQLAAHPIQLSDVAPPEAAQKGTQGGWRLDYAADGAGRPAGAQRVGVVNAVARQCSRP